MKMTKEIIISVLELSVNPLIQGRWKEALQKWTLTL